ncbi:MAG: ABC transporter ATP-binding protein [Rubrivivax sp.]|nr:ABC transporter ATP-binding protein [Rubrivivax sp.]
MPAIEVSHLTKEYRLGALQSLKDRLLNVGRRALGHAVPDRPMFKALNDVSFRIEPGEVVGIIGHNGAGKSTLLKMLARISTPTRGTVRVNGRIAPLIEVGAGFVPDFTGRENVYLNASILGMSRKEIDKKLDEIVDFAEIAEFIDTPVKRYSSGMQVKLAFAVATSIDSDILIVDEVLAVGDLAFQRKCFNRMESLIKGQGRTVLLVSHNIRQVERFCTRVMLMDHGTVKLDGGAQQVCNAFFDYSDQRIAVQAGMSRSSKRATTGEVELMSVSLVGREDDRRSEFTYGDDIHVKFDLWVKKPLSKPIFVLGVHTTDFVNVTTTTSGQLFRNESLMPGRYELSACLRKSPLAPGAYSVRLSIDVEDPVKNILYCDALHPFTIRGGSVSRSDPELEGFFLSNADWHAIAHKEPNFAGQQ